MCLLVALCHNSYFPVFILVLIALTRSILPTKHSWPDPAASASAAPAPSERKGLLSFYPKAVDHHRVGPLLRHVHVTDSDSEKIPNMGMTGGSTTSEGCCGAAMVACAELVRRLRPVKASVLAKKRAGNEKKEEADRVPVTATWQEIIAAASGSNVSLSASRAWRRGRSKEQADSPEEEVSHRCTSHC